MAERVRKAGILKGATHLPVTPQEQDKEEQAMDKNSGRLVEQLQNSQLRQRKVIQQLQVDNTRLLGDLIDIRHERDTFREEAARVRRENADLQNRLDEVVTECQDLKRERATLVRSATTDSVHVRGPRVTINSCPTGRVSVWLLGQAAAG